MPLVLHGRQLRETKGDAVCVAPRRERRPSSHLARPIARSVGHGPPREQRCRERISRVSKAEAEDLDAALLWRDRSRLQVFRVTVP